jgi:hypothetical protein
MRLFAARTAMLWFAVAFVVAVVEFVTVTSAPPFVQSADTDAWRQLEPLRLTGWPHRLAISVAPVVLFPLRQVSDCSVEAQTGGLCAWLVHLVFLPAKSVLATDVTFALVNTAIWLLFLGLVNLLSRFLRARGRPTVSAVTPTGDASGTR